MNNDFGNYDPNDDASNAFDSVEGGSFSENVSDSNQYQEVGFKSYKDNKSIIKLVIIGGAVLVFLIAIFVVLKLTMNKAKLEGVEIGAIDEFLYVDEEVDVSLKALGSGKLSGTKYSIVDDNNLLTITNNELSGASTSTKIVANKIGRTSINVTAQLGSVKKTASKDIVVCKRLNEEDIAKEFNVSVASAKLLDVELGIDDLCYGDIVFESANFDIATVDNYGKITGVKQGTTVVTISDKDTTVSVNVTVN